MGKLWVCWLVLGSCAWGADFLQPSESETAETTRRVRAFYEDGSPQPLAAPLTHYRLGATGWHPTTPGASTRPPRPALARSCRHVFRRYFPTLAQGTWAAPLDHDQATALMTGWMTQREFTADMDQIPREGRTSFDPWSADYWPLANGTTSYRYATPTFFMSYRDAISSYAQPADWMNLIASGGPAEWGPKVMPWSPAEKWDLTVGDEAFHLTREEKGAGAPYADAHGEVARWMGICHGWAAAAVMVPRPQRAVSVVGARGVPVTWYPDEIRAMASLAWANGGLKTNYVGGRCQADRPDTYPNGRLKQEECFDTNPSTFFLALGNLIGRKGKAFVMDMAFDQEVWNQPVVGYSVQFFNPLQPNSVSNDWRKVAVPYNGTFKRSDRFQKPLTRGVRTAEGYDDRGIQEVVGVIATVAYVGESRPNFAPQAAPDNLLRVTFTFDLEIYEKNGRSLPLGGEWHSNSHPDFLWVPQGGTTVATEFDRTTVSFDGKRAPDVSVTRAAAPASQVGYPLCRVLKHLVDGSSGTSSYRCL